jgi:hypothetical protein
MGNHFVIIVLRVIPVLKYKSQIPVTDLSAIIDENNPVNAFAAGAKFLQVFKGILIAI